MYDFGTLHIHEFTGGRFKFNPKCRPCMIAGPNENRGLIPTLKLCPGSTKTAANEENIQRGLAFVVDRGTRTRNFKDFCFSEDGVFLLCVIQPVPKWILGPATYRGKLPSDYILQAAKCAENCTPWWRERKAKGGPPQN